MIISKPSQNKKSQKNLKYPTKKQSFFLEKDCFFWPFLIWSGFSKYVLVTFQFLPTKFLSRRWRFWIYLSIRFISRRSFIEEDFSFKKSVHLRRFSFQEDFSFQKNWSNLNVFSAIDFTTPVPLCSENPCKNRLCTYWGLYAKVSWETFRACFLQSHYRDIPRWAVSMECFLA